jgi:N-methylhydantoinase B/oxoprolinase/acetone carboxylase alpha subunit
MIAATQLGRERFLKLIRRYGAETVLGAAYYWMDYSESRLRAEIAKIPDGDYTAESWLDHDGRNWDRKLKVKVTLVKRSDEITVDLTGSADEVETGFNVPFEGSLQVGCFYAIRTLLLDQATTPDFVPQNEGMFRPVKVVAPLGSIFNPRFPRACFARMAQIQRVIDCIIRALAPAMPEKVTAGNAATVMSVSYSGFDAARNQYWVCVEVNEGSYGARATKDGLDAVDNLMANTRNVPCEEIEIQYPLRVERYELRPEAPGAGTFRGGVGHVREVRFLTDGFFSCNGDRILEPPFGAFGGHDGLGAKLTMNPGTEYEQAWPSKVSGRKVKAGDVIQVMGPSSAGYGDPRRRHPALVLADWRDNVITLEEAATVYGVVIDPASGTVNEANTRARRTG